MSGISNKQEWLLRESTQSSQPSRFLRSMALISCSTYHQAKEPVKMLYSWSWTPRILTLHTLELKSTFLKQKNLSSMSIGIQSLEKSSASFAAHIQIVEKSSANGTISMTTWEFIPKKGHTSATIRAANFPSHKKLTWTSTLRSTLAAKGSFALIVTEGSSLNST